MDGLVQQLGKAELDAVALFGLGVDCDGAAIVDNMDERVKANSKAHSSAETWFVYILRCADGSLYTGITKDVIRRCGQHNAGTASRYTRSRLPVNLEYREPQATQSLALKREAAIKAMSRQEKESLIRLATSQDLQK